MHPDLCTFPDYDRPDFVADGVHCHKRAVIPDLHIILNNATRARVDERISADISMIAQGEGFRV
jgi:hypothetical protein